MIRVAAESRLDGRVIASDAHKLMGGSMLRPVPAGLQTTLTFVLYVHRPITEVDPGVRHRAGVMRISADA